MQNLFANYEILEEIGQGAIASVFKARQINLKRIVALKMIRQDLFGETKFLEMLKNEAVIAANLNHPCIREIYEIGRMGPSYYLCMEYVKGVSLKYILAESRKRKERLPLNIGLFIIQKIASALVYSHRLKVFHGGLHPSNVLISDQGKVKLSDFGIGRLISLLPAELSAEILQARHIYLSPEQQRREKIDNTADIFSFGKIMLEMLSPPPDLFPVLERCIENKQENRYTDTLSLLTLLEDFIKCHELNAGEKDLANYLQGLYVPQKEKAAEIKREELTSASEIFYQEKTPLRALGQKKGPFLKWALSGIVIILLAFFFVKPAYRNEDISRQGNLEEKRQASPAPAPLPEKEIAKSPPEKRIPVQKDSPAIKGTIFLNMQPANARVYLNNRYLGQGNQVIRDLPPGEHILKITHPDYMDEVRILKIDKEQTTLRLLYREGEFQTGQIINAEEK